MSEIDVSKCPHKDTCMYICDNVQDCLYKNYKRLVHTNNATKRARDDYKNIANKLKAENEALTEQLDAEMLKVTQLATEIVELNKYIDRAGIIGIIKVLKCLDEIEARILKCNDCWCNDCDDECISISDYVLQKIKEVKDNG